VAHLEKRLEEVAEVKDRLDRQLATQNEELRVQRAAIARTQRVLRNLSQNPDSATEPALKGPGSQPPGGLR
jgi:septal ring factor EnvC (AmiA/AmiB activator)